MTDRVYGSALLAGGLLAIFAFAMTFGFYWRHGSWVWERFIA